MKSLQNESQLVLRSNCNSLIPVTTTLSQLKASYEPDESSVKSSAVDRSPETPVVFRSLQQNTNITQPPDNWLKTSNQWEKLIKRFIRPHGSNVNNGPNEELAQSFQLANDAMDVLPYIDVVSNSDCLKSLLKVPYDNQQILSLAIHRIGDTFLFDSFDAYAYLLDAQRSDWHWIRKWFADNDAKRMALLLAANANRNRAKTIEKIKERDMLSKFLYYSIEENEYPTSVSPPLTGPPLLTSSSVATVGPDVSVAPSLPKSTLQKTVMWTLEDIKILVGSDLPVFSTGSHPCFSLRLCDQQKSGISVITGLEYWLDNLMCNVPEVLMCYHLDGIVQQYEVFKTEDLPNLSEESRFSPRVVKDFATNILSFLRSNATKEGHTYWLLKEPDIDVVKLYDITSLCEDFMDSVNDNPFALPLAVLLCRLAYTVLESADSSYDQVKNVPHLLDSCLRLVDRTRYPWLYSVVNYLHYIAATKRSLPPSTMSESKELENTVSVGSCDSSLENKSLLNLEYIANGLTFLLSSTGRDNSDTVSGKVATGALSGPSSRSVPVQWTVNQQDAMIAKLLRGAVCCYLHIAALDFDALVARQGAQSTTKDTDGGPCLCINIRQNLRLARDCLFALHCKMGDKEVEMGLRCAILQLLGDLHFVNDDNHVDCIGVFENEPSFLQSNGGVKGHATNLSSINSIISAACAKVTNNSVPIKAGDHLASLYIGGTNGSHVSWPKWISPIERIESAIKIYQDAFEGSDDKAAIVRRMANACVEFANAIIARSLELFSDNSKDAVDEPLDMLWKKAYFAFDKAALLFESVRPMDEYNLAVVESNRARLMRVCAYCQQKSSSHYLNEAIRRYGLALKHLSSSSVLSCSNLIARVHWDLSSVHLALADELSGGIEDTEDVDRAVLKNLADAASEAALSGLQEFKIRDAEICRREGKVRKKMLLRLISCNNDSKICNNYMRLAEKSFEKSLTVYAALNRWDDWTTAHLELSGLYLDTKWSLHPSIFSRKTMAAKVSAQLKMVVDKLLEVKSADEAMWCSISPAALRRSCLILSQLLPAVGDQRASIVKEVNSLIKKLTEIDNDVYEEEAHATRSKKITNDFFTLLEEITRLLSRIKLS